MIVKMVNSYILFLALDRLPNAHFASLLTPARPQDMASSCWALLRAQPDNCHPPQMVSRGGRQLADYCIPDRPKTQ